MFDIETIKTAACFGLVCTVLKQKCKIFSLNTTVYFSRKICYMFRLKYVAIMRLIRKENHAALNFSCFVFVISLTAGPSSRAV